MRQKSTLPNFPSLKIADFRLYLYSRYKLDVLLSNKLLKPIAAVLKRYWDKLVGEPHELTRQNRGFNVVSIFVFLLLAILIPLDWYLGLTEIAIILVITEAMLIVMYCLSRYRGMYQTGFNVYMVWSYLLITFVFIYNGGSEGPALYFFLLTYQLVVVFASDRLRHIGTLFHLAFPVGLLWFEKGGRVRWRRW